MIEYVPWSLSFEDSGRRGWGAVRPTPLQWEAVNFRGPDNDTADVEITGFGHRKIGFAEGPLVHSPAQLSTLMGVQMPSEDDVLHADKLPSFGGALSREESDRAYQRYAVPGAGRVFFEGAFANVDPRSPARVA